MDIIYYILSDVFFVWYLLLCQFFVPYFFHYIHVIYFKNTYHFYYLHAYLKGNVSLQVIIPPFCGYLNAPLS